MGPAIGIGMGYAIDAKGLNLISAVIAGAIGAGTFNNGVQAGNPISAYVAVLAAIEVTRLIQGKHRLIFYLFLCFYLYSRFGNAICRTLSYTNDYLDWKCY